MMDFFSDFKSNDARQVSLGQVYEMILHDGRIAELTRQYRQLTAQGLDAAAKTVKSQTPQVAVSFRMEGGKGKECCRECLYMMLIDFDAKAPDERLESGELERVKTLMRTSYHAALGYESLSGMGYHVVVPFVMPEGCEIDMAADAKRAEELYTRAYRHVANLYSVWCGHEMDRECKNVNRMTGLAHDAQAVMREDARPIRLTREELGVDKDGRLIRLRTPRRMTDKEGNPVSVPLGDRLERAERMVEEADTHFVKGSRHNFIMRVSFILNRMGVDEDEAAQALDEGYLGQMDGRPSDILHSCYRTASDEFGAWSAHQPAQAVKTEIAAGFLSKQQLQYDVLSQKTRRRQEDGQWTELKERDENDLYMACCAETGANLSERLFHTVLNSSVVPEVNPLRDYVGSLPPWTPDQPDYIAQAAAMVHMATDGETELWRRCFAKWFVAMVAGWTADTVVNHQVIVLIGRQGIYKSTWLNSLMPPRLRAYATDNIDIDRLDKDEQIRAAEYGLVNIDELDKMTDRQLNRLKSMITTQSVDVRAPFGRHKEKRVRVASYVASGNKEEFLTDQTGNRRWLPFHVEAIDSPYQHGLPHDGMYAQARYLLEHGYNYWFDLPDIEAMERHVESFMIPTSEEQLIPVYFSPATGDDTSATFYTLAEISAKITTYGNLKKNPDPRRLGRIMTKLGFVRERRGHESTRGYYVREHTQSEIESRRHPDVF